MPLDYDHAMGVASQDLEFAYDDRKTMLYALAIGMARDPMDRRELDFVFEKNLLAVPTLATVISPGALDVRRLNIDYAQMLHGEQRLTMHRPLPAAARIKVDTRTISLHDKGAGKGALIVSEIAIRDALTGEAYCTLNPLHFARGDGGFAMDDRASAPPPQAHGIPDRPPDRQHVLQTRPDQALLYRLLGDRNELHIDPDVAAEAGFERPILHGLCTYGMCCHAVLAKMCDYDAARLRSFEARFSAPVIPGDNLTIDLWRDGDVVSFEASVRERGVKVIRNGRALIG